MEINLTTHYLAIETERTRLPKQAERGWLDEQAELIEPRRFAPISIRQRIGGVLIHAGERVQGASQEAMLELRHTHMP